MRVIVCDRCKEIITCEPNIGLVLNSTRSSVNGQIDWELCNNCVREFTNFINNWLPVPRVAEKTPA